MCAQEGVHVVGLDVAGATLLAEVRLGEEGFRQGYICNLHGVILVLLELIERIVFLRWWSGLDLLDRGRRRDVHAEDSPKVVQLPLLGLPGLYAHRAHQGVEALREGGKALLLHADALERVVVNASLVGEGPAAGADEHKVSASHLLTRIDIH